MNYEYLGAAYYLVGFVIVVCIDRRLNGPLSIASLFVDAIGAVAWPFVLAVMAIGALLLRPSWFTQKRW